ncbi:cupin domain-containing protein [uncultured Microbacterium sp.]|uniref:cupin domain-containing protein n=1 Tax=uncultured Microbacterium sp. TaxID=191216 RepID=UPI0028EB7247|nr:cupin domain-containing protein [uncultured Microbacterium sp.]
MFERRGDWGYDYDLHDSTHPVRMQWHFYDTSSLPVVVQSWELPPGGDEGMHTHDRDENPKDEMYLVTEGQGRMTVDGRVYDLGPGDAVFAAAGAEHDLVNIGDTHLRLIVVWGFHCHADYSRFGVAKAAHDRRRQPGAVS